MNELARLKWQCRRGTKELDLMLKKYLETGYLLADDEEKALFVELLKLEDDELTGVLMGDRKPDAKKLADLIYKIAK
jgi:antitoxin CptB